MNEQTGKTAVCLTGVDLSSVVIVNSLENRLIHSLCGQTGEAAVSLKEADLSSVVLKILKNEETAPELLCNTLALLRTLGTAGRWRQWSCNVCQVVSSPNTSWFVMMLVI